MTEEARKARNEYRREWYRRNTDKVRAQIDRYWEKRATRMAQISDDSAGKDERGE